MIEVTLRKYLSDNLENIAVVMEQPKNPPKEYVILRLVDYGKRNQIDAATFFVKVVSDTFFTASSLRDHVRSLLIEFTSLDSISHASIGGESASIDGANHVYNYDITLNVYFYGEET